MQQHNNEGQGLVPHAPPLPEKAKKAHLIAQNIEENAAYKHAPITVTRQKNLPALWRAARAKMPRLQDPMQKRAAGNIVKFLALMLVLTLVARGTAGATLAQVKTQTPESGEVVQAVRGSGNVVAGGSTPVEAPEGLSVQDVLVTTGEKVDKGQGIVRFSAQEVEEKLARAKADLQELALKLNTLGQAKPQDNTALHGAQNAYDWARQDLDAARANGNRAVDEAQAGVQNTRDTLAAAEKAQAALPKDATSEEKAAAGLAVETAKTAHEAAKAALEEAKRTKESGIQAAERAVETARQSLESTQTAEADARQQAANTAAQNNVDAEKTRLDIEKAQKMVDELQKIHDAGGVLAAGAEGTILELPTPGAATDATPIARVANTQNGYVCEVMVPKQQAEKLAAGGKAQVTKEGGSIYYTPTAEATIAAIGQADESGNVKITLRLSGDDWKQNQSVQAKIEQSRTSHPSCVPVQAVHTDNAGAYVLVMRNKTSVLGTENQLAQVRVNVVASDESLAAIEGPLEMGEQVVTGSTKPVQEGDRVRLQEE